MASHRSFAAAAVFLLAAACATPPAVVQPSSPVRPPRVYSPDALRMGLNAVVPEPFSDTRAVDVIYATNRVPGASGEDCSAESYGVEVSSFVSYGVCGMNVPKLHEVGGFEAAPNPRADPHKYFRSLSHLPLGEASFKERLLRSKPTDALVFVHGFNVKFDEAVLRSAQIAYDLKFQGPVVLFSWPAGPGPGMLDGAIISRTYEMNRANAANSINAAADFLKTLSGLGITVHMMVHSMGHQVVLPAVGKAAVEVRDPFLGEVVLNAPDVPVKDFQRLAPRLRALSDRVTVYCSYNDNAIAASETFNRSRRMGGCERAEGVDVVNVGGIDAPALGIGGLGHGYYASRPILTDIHQVLLGVEAPRRLFIRKSEPNSTEDYYLRP
jgi:esterase/lipase superfamily enzyme